MEGPFLTINNPLLSKIQNQKAPPGPTKAGANSLLTALKNPLRLLHFLFFLLPGLMLAAIGLAVVFAPGWTAMFVGIFLVSSGVISCILALRVIAVVERIGTIVSKIGTKILIQGVEVPGPLSETSESWKDETLH